MRIKVNLRGKAANKLKEKISKLDSLEMENEERE